MSRTLTASDRSRLIRLASTMEKGSAERKAILAGLQKSASFRSGRDLIKWIQRAMEKHFDDVDDTIVKDGSWYSISSIPHEELYADSEDLAKSLEPIVKALGFGPLREGVVKGFKPSAAEDSFVATRQDGAIVVFLYNRDFLTWELGLQVPEPLEKRSGLQKSGWTRRYVYPDRHEQSRLDAAQAELGLSDKDVQELFRAKYDMAAYNESIDLGQMAGATEKDKARTKRDWLAWVETEVNLPKPVLRRFYDMVVKGYYL